jgi:hypothetical protein
MHDRVAGYLSLPLTYAHVLPRDSGNRQQMWCNAAASPAVEPVPPLKYALTFMAVQGAVGTPSCSASAHSSGRSATVSATDTG